MYLIDVEVKDGMHIKKYFLTEAQAHEFIANGIPKTVSKFFTDDEKAATYNSDIKMNVKIEEYDMLPIMEKLAFFILFETIFASILLIYFALK